MAEKTFAEMSHGEFESLLDKMQTEEFGDLTTEEFFTALSALADMEIPHETIELTATVKGGQLAFLEPAPLHVHGNAIHWGGVRVVIQLVPEAVSRPV
jgi:hypothetical protein